MKAEEIIPATHRLEQSGMTRNEAEAVVSELQAVVAPLATKVDLAELGQSIRGDMASMEKSIRGDMASMEKSIRGDMATMEKSIRGDVASMKQSMATYDSRLEAKISSLEARLTWRLVLAMISIAGVVLAILRVFP